MIARTRTWAEVKVGSFIQDKTGKVWKVAAEKPGFYGLVDRDGTEKIVKARAKTDAVQIMYLSQAELEEILRKDFGAELEAVRAGHSHTYVCKPWEGRRIEEMKSHLMMMHGVAAISANDPGVSAGMNSKKQLTEAHDEAHREPNDRWRPHVHDDNENIDRWRNP